MNIPRVRTRRQFGAAANAVKFAKRRPGLLGRPDAGGTFTVTAPGGHGYVFFRYVQGFGSSLGIAVDRAGVGTTGNTPIWVEQDENHQWVITGLRYKGS